MPYVRLVNLLVGALVVALAVPMVRGRVRPFAPTQAPRSAPRPVRVLRHLLWIDSAAGLSAGAAVLALSGWLSEVYGLPRPWLVGMGVANLAYGTYSGALARRARRPRGMLLLLVFANATWAGLCGLAAVALADTASVFGLAHLVGEGMFVGGLATLEWRERERLRCAT